MSAGTVFAACDVRGRGFLEPEDLGRACPDLSTAEKDYIFRRLDRNGDGRISRDEFEAGFESVIASGERTGYKDLGRRASTTSPRSPLTPRPTQLGTKPEIVYNFEPGIDSALWSAICKDDNVLSLYEQLQQSGASDQLEKFEKVMGTFYKELKEQKEHNERLQAVYAKEKEQHSKYMGEVESELDQQLAAAEERARRLERARLEKEKEEMRERLEGEIKDLSGNIRRLQKMEASLQEVNERTDRLTELKGHLNELNSENRGLKSTLTAKQTEMVLIKSQMAQLRQEFSERCGDLATEKEELISYIQEQENLNQQLQLLYDANTKLHDTNDQLRSTIQSKQAFCRQYNIRSPSPITPPGTSPHSRQGSVASYTGSATMRVQGGALATPKPSFASIRGWATRDSNETDDDSGLARLSDGATSGLELYGRDNHESDFSSLEEEASFGRVSGRSSMRSRSPLATNGLPRIGIDCEPTGPPERTFRVVLAGDASVGKSSLIMRLVKNAFVGNLQSTLGVDFHVKSLNVDGKNVAVQLWDTAGQERFRSMCKNYFRRADGAFLVYDVTSESSFLAVRDWLETLAESVPKRIPIIICGNKSDARLEAQAEGRRCVTEEEGRKIAKANQALFMETSAKSGANVQHAVIEMARELLANEDMEAYSVGIPILVGSCVLGMGANAAVLWLGLRRAKRRSLTLRLTLSLAGNDLVLLSQLAFGLVMNSYLPFVQKVRLPPQLTCFMFLPEAFRLGTLSSFRSYISLRMAATILATRT